MRTPLAVLICCTQLLLFATSAWGQTATVRGFVTSRADGQPFPAVNVVLTAEDGQLYGTATDSDGFYAISRVPPGLYRLQASFIGFETYADTLRLQPDQILTRNIALVESQAALDEIVVESERETAGAANISAGLQTVRPADIELVPAPDVSADLVNYLTAMPGVIAQGDRGGQLFIRGGEPSQNMVLLDGMLVYQPFHVVGFYSAFPSEIINTADVYAGGYGGRYGGRLASVIDISARTGNKRRFVGAASVAPFVSALRVEGPIVPGRVSVLTSVRESMIEQGASNLVDEELPFSFGDRFGKIHANLSESSQLSISALSTYDEGRLGLDPLDADLLTEDVVRWENEAVGGRFLLLPATMPVFAEVLVSYSGLENSFGPPGDPERTSSVERYGTAVNLTHYLGSTDVQWGLFVNTSKLTSDLGGKFQNLELKEEFVTEAGAYLEPVFDLGGGLRVQPGVRLHTFPSKDRTFIEPRLRTVWNLGRHRLSAAAGLYHQEVIGLNDRRDAGDIFTAWTASPLGTVPEAIHLVAGWRVRVSEGLTASVEGFYKELSNLTVSEWTAFPRFTTRLQPADGNVVGADVRLEYSRPSFYGVVSYGYSSVEYEAVIPALQLLYGEERTTYHPPHDRRHQLQVMTSLSQWGFDLNVRWQLGTGLPFNESLGFDRFILLDSLVNFFDVPGDARVLYSRPYTGRLPTYHRLDVSLDRGFDVSARARLTVQAGLINGYDRRNLFYLDLFTLRRVDQLPLIPSLGLKLEIR